MQRPIKQSLILHHRFLIEMSNININISKSIRIFIRKFILSLGILIFILLLSLFGPRAILHYERGIFYDYDLILEYKLSKTLNKVIQTKNLQPISLQDFSDKKIVRACVQWAYATQTHFEERIGEKVNNFNETSDHDGDLLWLFFSDGSTSRARMAMNFWNDGKSQCTEKTLAISFKLDEKYPGVINFFFKKEN